MVKIKKVLCLAYLTILVSCNGIGQSLSVSGSLEESSHPLRGFSQVSVHPDKLLKMRTSCNLSMRMEIIQAKNYAETILELKNRALMIGGNAVSLSNWKETTSSTYLVGKIYLCETKPYHLHPHPLGV